MNKADTSYEKARDAYLQARKSGFARGLQKAACQEPYIAFLFAKHIPGANIEYCQKYACKEPVEAFRFAINMPGADVEYCKTHMNHLLDKYLQRQMRNSLK